VFANTAFIVRRLSKEIQRIDANLTQGNPPYAEVLESPVDQASLVRADQKLTESLQKNGADDEQLDIAQRLVGLIAEAADATVARIRPFEIADQWKIDRRAVVTVCLEAVVAGLLEFSWDIICPSCRTVALQLTSLSQLKEKSHCHLCDISISTEFDRTVEATFRPTTAIRPLPDRPYCIGGPFRTPHVVAQTRLPAGGSTRLQVPNQIGRYQLFIRGGACCSVEIASDGQRSAEITAGKTVEPGAVALAPGGTLDVRDGLSEERHVKLEHLAWASVAATPPYVSTVSSFRRLFSAEVLRAGLKVRVAHVALLFTDLTNSTSMYVNHGDATAYRFVLDHFAVLRYVIDGHRGTVVKTIGDAVMAAFCDERDAVRAAIDLQRAYRSLLASGRDEAQGVELRVGVYAGTSYLMTANGILDYFGQTVNTANRLQCECQGGQIVLPAEMAACGQAHGWLVGADIVDRFDADLKGIAEAVSAVRLSVQGV
jgi:class 3 adenylate cyclase